MKPSFVQELDRLRNLPATQYDAQIIQINETLQGLLHGVQTTDALEAAERRKLREQDEVEDESTFHLEKAARTGEVSAEETKASIRKLIFLCVIAGALGVTLVACIAGGVIGYSFWQQKPAEVDQAKNKEPPPKEMKAKIKTINLDEKRIKFLMFTSKTEVYHIEADKKFFERDGQALPGLDAPQLKAEEYCVILPTENRQALQWLMLTPPPK